MWTTKYFTSAELLRKWVKRNEHSVQWEEVAVNNGWAVRYRPLVKPRMPK